MKRKKATYLLILALLTLMILSTMKIYSVNAIESKNQTFRPFYAGYQKGTTYFIGGTNITTYQNKGIDREINFVGWGISKITMQIRICNTFSWNLPQEMNIYFSLNKGQTFNITRSNYVPALSFTTPWAGSFYYADYLYDFPESDYSLFTLDTRMIFQFEYNIYLANVYWGFNQQPVPPYDFRDASNNYVQYYILFHVTYTEQTIEYKGSSIDFPYDQTKARLTDAATMIQNCMFPSGATNEIVGKSWGKDSWIVMYSAQLGMNELINLQQVFPTRNYLLSVKRFIEYMFSKQNSDGSFYFYLTDGDQHPKNESGTWFGWDKIDSFSALAITLMRTYYTATEDIAIINKYWNKILLSKQFLYDLMNTTCWLPYDGYHYNGTAYNKSEWVLLHDSIEVYFGFKDMATLYGVKGITGEQTYWNNFADSLKNGINSHFWNESLHRFMGYYHPKNNTYDSTAVYSMITPTMFTICPNQTRAWLTVQTYLNWGTMSGRYYNWSGSAGKNEYPNMGAMAFTALAQLNKTYSYHAYWMNSKFMNITKFIFDNPIYPKKDLQNEYGFLDWVNLQTETYAPEYARLIESSASFIHAYILMPYMEGLGIPFWEYPNVEVITVYWLSHIMTLIGIGSGMGVIGIPCLTVYFIKKENSIQEQLQIGLIFFTLWLCCLCLVIGWLWH